MNRPFNKKRFWLIIAILALVEALVCYVVLQREYLFPSDEVSEIYDRYEKVEGIDVSFVKDYKVNDTLFVDVTLLEAKDSVGWTTLQADFHVPVIPEEYRKLLANSSSVDFWLASKKDPTIKTDTIISHNDLIVMSRQRQTICVCHIENKRQADAIMDKQTNELSTSKNTKQ